MLVRIKVWTQELQFRSSVFGQVDSLIVFNQINTALFFKSLNSTKELREKKQASPITNSAPLVPVPRDNPFHQFLFLVLLVVFSLILNNIICWLTNCCFFFFATPRGWLTDFGQFLPITSWKIRNSLIYVAPHLSFFSPNQCLIGIVLLCLFFIIYLTLNIIVTSLLLVQSSLDSLCWFLIDVEWS